MKYFRRRVLLTTLLAAGLVVAFSWIAAWQNYGRLSREAAKEKPLTLDAVSYTLRNLSKAWTDYEKRIINRYEVEAVFASLALQNVADGGTVSEESPENGIVVSVRGGELFPDDPAVRKLGLEASLFQGRKGSFTAPDQPSTYVVYSRIGQTDSYIVKWHEETVVDDIVGETIDIPGILKWTEITYNVPTIFVSLDPDSGEPSGILYKNDHYFSDCESLGDLGLTREDLEDGDAKGSGTLEYDDKRFSYLSGTSAMPAGYVLLLQPIPNLYSKAFVQEGYMIAAIIILLATLLVAGFSLYPYVYNNIFTPDEETAFQPSRVRSSVCLYGIFGLIMIALCGFFGYALERMHDDTVRGRELLDMMADSIAIHTERYSENTQAFRDIYLDYGSQIAEFLDAYPELRDTEVLKTLAESISASSITLYDSSGRETVSSGPWIGLKLGEQPDSSTYDFRRNLNGVPYIIHDPETDETTGLTEMRLGIRIRDDRSRDLYGVMLLNIDTAAMANDDLDPEKTVRQILRTFSDDRTTLWIADAETGRILVSGKEDLEGTDSVSPGLSEMDLADVLTKTPGTEESGFRITSVPVESSGILEWTGAPEGVIACCRSPKTPVLSGTLSLVLTGCLLFCLIYSVIAWLTFSGYTEDFFNTYKKKKGNDDPKKKLGPLRRAIAEATPLRKGAAALEITTAFFILQMLPIVNSGSSSARETVYSYVYAGDWEKGFNLYAAAAILLLFTRIVLILITIRFITTVCGMFSGPRGKTILHLIANVMLYVGLIFFLAKAFELLGFSPTAIAAAMGSLALAVSLGAQNFVADIFAGLTYVFEGTVHIGDNVEMAIYGSPLCKGRIVEIGIRCVKLLTREGDIITCNNRDIRTIKNSTQQNSLVICEMVVSSALSADEVERILNEELPGIGRNDRRILNGPVYNGITLIGNGTMTLSVSAECREDDYSYVRDRLNVALQRIFRDHGLNI